MGFDLYGVSPRNKEGEYFRNNVWWWRGLQGLIMYSCQDILNEEEIDNLGWNNGYEYSEFMAKMIAERLNLIANDEKLLANYEARIMGELGEYYKGCWSKENILEFVDFLENSGGFSVC
jgi:hypothetical protein